MGDGMGCAAMMLRRIERGCGRFLAMIEPRGLSVLKLLLAEKKLGCFRERWLIAYMIQIVV